MGEYVANEVIFKLVKKGHIVANSKVLVLGITFKENCPDIRNSKVIDIITHLQRQGISVDLFDPSADVEEVKHEYGLQMLKDINTITSLFDAIILAVAHKEFLNVDWRSKLNRSGILYDVKGVLNPNLIDARL
jgi:UDP-N-acetyl-D-galactosamine dehydrogenase